MVDVEKLRQVFQSALNLPAGTGVDELRYQSVDQWDSLAHMALVAALEDAFEVMIDTEDVVGLDSFDKARELLDRLTAGRPEAEATRA